MEMDLPVKIDHLCKIKTKIEEISNCLSIVNSAVFFKVYWFSCVLHLMGGYYLI